MNECNPNWYTHAIDINFQCFQIHSERMSITNKCFNILNTKQRPGFDPWVRKISWRRERQPTLIFSPGESHGERLMGYSPWGQKRVGHDLATRQQRMMEDIFLTLSPPEGCFSFPVCYSIFLLLSINLTSYVHLAPWLWTCLRLVFSASTSEHPTQRTWLVLATHAYVSKPLNR